ncbi:BatA domain-containing protein [Roseibacillus ishigakijimensis]|uniref:BatA and WFA domain-containing protein n=2 Tax=Roseibacillus ishigakijimensis TaxID=454146 RepID=A0A934RKX9_9BACT|nr:BatA and WFA domain-containing protein [Roseibacillus ishigakijimensis]
MILTNPLGLLALLGIPAVLLIHFLQRQARVVPVSTLFLLEQTQREATSGRRFDRLTSSVPLWLQLLMVLLLTWLLTEPRYRSSTTTRQVAVVLDSSASMAVFQEEARKTLARDLPSLQGLAARLHLSLLSDDPAEPLLYAGTDLKEALTVLESWQPRGGARDPAAALRLARSRIRSEGLLVYLTDHVRERPLPFEAQLLAVGHSSANTGFTGLSFAEEGASWQATVRNYSDQEVSRSWSVRYPDGSRSEPRLLTLGPDGLTTLTGRFPDKEDHLTVQLEGDAFALDDQLPLVRPQPKNLLIASSLPEKFRDFEKRFRAFFPPQAEAPASAADLTLTAYDPLLPVLPETHSILTIHETTPSRRFLSGGIVAEPHPLMRGLNWQALQSRETVTFPLQQGDDILLWQGQRPLIAMRESREETSGQQRSHLIFNFDLSQSNALKLPAIVILLHRFASQLQAEKVAFAATNSETGQVIALAHEPGAELTLTTWTSDHSARTAAPLPAPGDLRAPVEPCFFEVHQGETLLLRSASHFADTREADLRLASATSNLDPASATAIEHYSEEDRWWPLWVTLTLAALLAAWHFTKEKLTPEAEVSTANATNPS